MSDFVLDCSLTISWFFQEEANAASDKVLESLDNATGHVPALWPYEVANVLRCAQMRKRLSEADALHIIEQLGSMPIEVQAPPDHERMAIVLSLANKYKLSAYDAAYLELAMRMGLPLATMDKGLAQAAKTAGVATGL